MDWSQPITVCESLVLGLKEWVSYEEFYAKGMVRTAYRDIKDTGTLGNALLELRNYMTHKGEQAQTLANDLVCDLIDPLKAYMNTQGENWQEIARESKKLQTEMQFARFKHDFTYKKYVEKWQEVGKYRENAEKTGEIEENFRSLEGFIRCRREGWTVEKEYKQALSAYDSIRTKYNTRIVSFTQNQLKNAHQTMERSRRQFLRDILRKVAIYETSWLRNIQYEAEKLVGVSDM